MNTTTRAKNPTGVAAALWHLTAFGPIAMSLTALSLVLFHIALHGTARETDEGTVAHLWQLLMGLQIPLIAWFAIRWFSQSAGSVAAVFVLQFLAGVAAVAPVWYYHL